jgi:hypothetical protein
MPIESGAHVFKWAQVRNPVLLTRGGAALQHERERTSADTRS